MKFKYLSICFLSIVIPCFQLDNGRFREINAFVYTEHSSRKHEYSMFEDEQSHFMSTNFLIVWNIRTPSLIWNFTSVDNQISWTFKNYFSTESYSASELFLLKGLFQIQDMNFLLIEITYFSIQRPYYCVNIWSNSARSYIWVFIENYDEWVIAIINIPQIESMKM